MELLAVLNQLAGTNNEGPGGVADALSDGIPLEALHEDVQTAIEAGGGAATGTMPAQQSLTLSKRFVGYLNEPGPPTSGTWTARDDIIDSNQMRWVCITGGTPGVWNPAGYGNSNQIATEFNPSTWIENGGPVTVNTTPSTITVDSTTGFPSTGTFIAGTGVPEDTIPTRVEVTYTGTTATTFTGCTIPAGSEEIPDLTHVWYSKSGLRAACLEVSNQIRATRGIDGRPHDLVLVAAFDTTTVSDPEGEHGRGDYDIIFTREAGSYGVCIFDLPVKFARDTLVTDGAGGELMKIAGGTTSVYNNEISPMPTGTIDFMATIRGAQGADDHLVFRRAADTDARIKFLNNAGVELMYMIEAATCIPNATDLRFMTSSGSGYASLQMTSGATFSLRHAGSGGSRVLASNGSTVLETISDTGVHVFAGAKVQKRTTGTQGSDGALALNASLGNSASILLNANVTSSSISNPSDGQQYTITFLQDGTGGRTYVYPTNCKFAGAAAPSDTTANRRTSVTFEYETASTTWYEISRAVAVG